MRHISKLVSIGVSIFMALTVVLSGFPLNVIGLHFSDTGGSVAHAQETTGTILYRFSLDPVENSTSPLGITIVDNILVISDSGDNETDASDNRFLRYTLDGTFIDDFPQDGSTAGFGYRDLAFDGTYILGSDDSSVKKIDPETFTVVDSVTNPENSTHRGLAYDASDNSIWSTNFKSGPLVKFDADTGETIEVIGTPSVSPYGIDLDPFTTPGTTSLWYAEPSSTGTFHLSRASTVSGTITYIIDLTEEVPGGLSGGLEIINNHPYYPGKVVAIMVDQIGGEVLFVDITDVPDPMADTIELAGQMGGYVNGAALQGNYAYVCEASTMKIYDISGISPEKVGTVCFDTEDEPMGITLAGDRAYMHSGNSIYTVDISDPLNPVIAGVGEVEGVTWPQDVSYTSTHAYLAVGSSGLTIANIVDPAAPVVTSTISVNVNDVFVSGAFAYTLTNNSANLTIYNVADPSSPVLVSDMMIDTASDIFVSGSYVYITGATETGLKIYNVSNPAAPALSGTTGIGTSMGLVTVAENRAYVLESDAQGVESLGIYDVSNAVLPSKLGGGGEYHYSMSLSASGSRACVAHNGVYELVDVSNPASPSSSVGTDAPMMMNCVGVGGDYMYIGGEKLFRYSLADPANPVMVQAWEDWPMARRVIANGNTVFALINGQVNIIDITDPGNPSQSALYTPTSGNNAIELFVQGTCLYIATSTNEVEIVDISQLSSPAKIGELLIDINELRNSYSIKDLFVAEDGQTIYIAYYCATSMGNPCGGFQIFDISTPSAPVWQYTEDYDYAPVSIWVEETTLFLGTIEGDDGKIIAYNVSDPTAPDRLDSEYLWGCEIWDVEVRDGIIIVGAPHGSIHTYQQSANGDLMTGPVGHMPESADTATYSGSDGTYAYSISGYANYGTKDTCGSKGIYTLKIPKGEPGKCYIMAAVMPPEAAEQGCTATPDEPVECECGEEQVPVTATAAEPWTFKEWTGAATGSSPATVADCPGDGTGVAIANFVCPILTLTAGPQNPSSNQKHADGVETYDTNLVVNTEKSNPDNKGLTVTIEPPEARTEGCTITPGHGFHEYAAGTDVTLSATAVDRWHFSEWMGDATGTGTINVNMNEDKVVTARFVKEVPIIDIRLSANEEDDWEVNSVTFTAFGTGDDKEDVTAARLYLNGNTLLATGAYSADNGNISFNVGQTVPKNSSITLLMTYTFDERKALPCDGFSAKIDMGNISALPKTLPPGLKLPVPPTNVTGGPTSIKNGNFIDEWGNEQWALPGEALDEPLVAKLYHQHPDTVTSVKIMVSPGQWGQDYGSKLSNNEFERITQLDGNGRVSDTLTLGTLKDDFGIDHPHCVEFEARYNPESCIATGLKVFSAYAAGMDVTAQYDGNKEDENRFDMYVSNIEAANIFTAKMEISPIKSVTQVTFEMNGVTKQGELVNQNREYRTTFDMADIDKTATMTVTATLNDGTEMQKVYTLEAIAFPEWSDAITSISESFTKEFKGDEEKYRIGFSYPVNFVWSDAVPGNVGMLGGLDFDLPIEFNAWADYYLNQRSGFGGDASGSITILGQEIEAEGSLEGTFDQYFEFERGSGQMSITTTFDLPSKSFSKTFPVSGVPVTVAGELGGSIRLYVNGSAVLNSDVEFERANITPGVTISGTITVSISAAFGVVKASVIGEPTATLEIQINYTTKSGTKTTWSGTVRVPIRIVGSIFWDAATIELYSTELGPWNFGTGGAPSGSSFSIDSESIEYSFDSEMPDILSSSSISSGSNQMVVWISDTDPSPGSPDPDVYYRYNDGSGWTGALPITTNDYWEMDPVVVSLADGKALAAWTTNDGDHSLTDLNQILSCQDIAYAVWDGSAWSAPGYIIDDNESDGTVDLAYDSYNNRVIAVWLHDANSDNDMDTHTEWEVRFAVYDVASGTWGLPQAVPTTDSGSADFMPAVASDGLGNTSIVWVKDMDGVLYSEEAEYTNGSNADTVNSDCNIYCAQWNGSVWSTPAALSVSNDETEQTPTVAFADDGDGVAAWATQDKLYYAIYRADTDTWSAPGLVDESEYFIEEPQVVIDSAGVATLIWRGYAGYDGDLFSSTYDLVAGSEWSAPEQITSDDSTDWHVSVATGADDEIIASWSKNDFSSTDDGAVSGFSNNIQLGQTNLDSAVLTGNFSDNGTDIDADGLYDFLSVAVQADIKTPGNYGVKADLYANDKLVEAQASVADLPSGNHTFILNFPGGFISDQQANGPFDVKNVMLLDENMSPMQTDFAASPHVTSAYTFDQFVEGAVSIENDEYLGTEESASITVRDDGLNINPAAADTVVVIVTSTVDPAGIPITLTETGDDTGVFTGTVGFTGLLSDPAAGKLFVINSATVLVTYSDEDPSYIWKDTALWSSPVADGDANGDGVINIQDIMQAARIILEMDDFSLGSDINHDGIMNVLDVTGIARVILGLD